jgi:hypothetical protein
VTAQAVGPLVYSWYKGNPRDISVALGVNSTQTVTEAGTYWVRVTSGCGTVDSAPVTVTLSAPICSAPRIVTPPGSGTIASRSSWTFSVGVTGSEPFQYQWYEGIKPIALNTISAAASFTLNDIQRTFNTWVRITNACGSAESETVTVTVKSGRRRSAAHK